MLQFRGKTFLDLILEAISRSPIENTVVVVGRHRDEIQACVAPSVHVVYNPQYELGMITSLQTGIRALQPQTAGALLFLVDHPLVDHETIESLAANLAPDRIVLPTFGGRRGHPVLFGADILQEILALGPSEGANIVVRKDPARIVQTPVNSPGILIDIDTPEDFQRLQKEYESR